MVQQGAFGSAPCLDFTETAVWGDFDFDGWLDLFLPCYAPPPGASNRVIVATKLRTCGTCSMTSDE